MVVIPKRLYMSFENRVLYRGSSIFIEHLTILLNWSSQVETEKVAVLPLSHPTECLRAVKPRSPVCVAISFLTVRIANLSNLYPRSSIQLCYVWCLSLFFVPIKVNTIRWQRPQRNHVSEVQNCRFGAWAENGCYFLAWCLFKLRDKRRSSHLNRASPECNTFDLETMSWFDEG